MYFLRVELEFSLLAKSLVMALTTKSGSLLAISGEGSVNDNDDRKCGPGKFYRDPTMDIILLVKKYKVHYIPMMLGVVYAFVILSDLGFAHGGEKPCSMVFLTVERASPCEVRSFVFLVVFRVYLSCSSTLELSYL